MLWLLFILYTWSTRTPQMVRNYGSLMAVHYCTYYFLYFLVLKSCNDTYLIIGQFHLIYSAANASTDIPLPWAPRGEGITTLSSCSYLLSADLRHDFVQCCIQSQMVFKVIVFSTVYKSIIYIYIYRYTGLRVDGWKSRFDRDLDDEVSWTAGSPGFAKFQSKCVEQEIAWGCIGSFWFDPTWGCLLSS